ncbi:MAG: ABC transporter permease [Trueperaceae bacterium]|nr:ABC transporter permease [Trueperaceae bacterium]
MIAAQPPEVLPRRNRRAATGRYLRTLRLELGAELLKNLRIPVYAVSTIAFPVMFYVVFGATFGREPAGPVNIATYMLATYGAFGVVGAALFSFGVSVAIERGQGWMRLKRASPMPPSVLVLAKLGNALVFSAAVVVALMIAGFVVAGVLLSVPTYLQLFFVLLLGAVPFCVIGQAFGYALGPNSAPVVINLVYLPMAFASGLWLPIHQLPGFLQAAAPFLPAFHLGQLALSTVGAHAGGDPAGHAFALVLTTLVAGSLAMIAYRRSSIATYG